MIDDADRAYSSQHLLLRSVLTLLAAYTIALGGTLTGVLIVEFQIVALTVLTLGGVAWLVWFWRRSGHLAYPPLGVALVLWMVAYGVSIARHPAARVLIGGWWAALYLGFWLVVVDVRRRGVHGRWITDAVAVAMIPAMLLAVAQVQPWYGAWLALERVTVAFVPPRPPGTLGNANALGAVLAMLVPFALVRVGWSPRGIDRVLWTVWLVGAGVVLYLTFSRGAWLATLVGVTVWAGLMLFVRRSWSLRGWWHTRSSFVRRGVIALLVAVVMAAVGLALLTARAFDTPRRETSSRLTYLRVAWDVFRAEPIIGSGPLTYGLALLENRSFPPEQPHAHAHNIVFNTGAELGLLGLAALMATVGLALVVGWRLLRRERDPFTRAHRAACAGALAAIAAHSMVDMPLIVPAVMLFALAILAVFVTEVNGSAESGQRLPYRIAVTVLIGGVLTAGWWSARGYRVYVQGERALVAGDFALGLETLETARDGWPALPLYQAEVGYACGLAVAHGDAACLDDGIAAYRRALEAEPQHAIWWANLAALYWAADQPDAAVAALETATAHAPEAADLWLNLGSYNETLGRADAARFAYAQALEADDDWAYTRFWDATPLRARVRAESGIADSPFERALDAWAVGERETAAAVLEATITHDPSQPKPYVQLARLYIAGGDLAQAQDYLAAARVLAHTTHDDVWNLVVEAELARAQGDNAQYWSLLDEARALLWPDDTGYPLPYGLDVTYLQFWRVRVGGVLLPQLIVYAPDPELVDYLLLAAEAAP